MADDRPACSATTRSPVCLDWYWVPPTLGSSRLQELPIAVDPQPPRHMIIAIRGVLEATQRTLSHRCVMLRSARSRPDVEGTNSGHKPPGFSGLGRH